MVKAIRAKFDLWIHSELIYIVLPIIIVSYFAHWTSFVPAIYLDDWTQKEMVLNDTLQWFNLLNRRPLHYAPFLIQYQLFGLNVTAFYVVLWGVQIVSTLLVYKIVNRIPNFRKYSFDVLASIFFLVFPTVYTHMWLTMLPIYCVLMLTLLYAYLLLKFATEGRVKTLILALCCMWVSFYLYEAQMGIVCAWSFLLACCYKKISAEHLIDISSSHRTFIQSINKRRLALLTPIVFAGGFVLWRIWGQQTIGVQDPYLYEFVPTPLVLFERLSLGLRINLMWGWAIALKQMLPMNVSNKYAYLILFGMLLVFWGATSQIIHSLKSRVSKVESWPFIDRWPTMRVYILSSFVGLLMIIAGYVPVIAIFLPSLAGDQGASRHNLFASFGGAIFVASVLMIGAILFSKTRQGVRYLFLISAVSFLILGVVVKAHVQQENSFAWREQQAIWQELFSVAPDFEDDTMILFILPDNIDRIGYTNLRRSPLGASWEVSSAVRILYNNPTLSADIIFPDLVKITEPILTAEGILTRDTGTVTP